MCPFVSRYHVPRSWLKPAQNVLVLFEELGGDASKISLMKRSVAAVCAQVSEHHPNINKNWHSESESQKGAEEEITSKAKVHLHCASGQFISAIRFASFGTPSGTCGNFQKGTCHAPNSQAVLEKVYFKFSSLFFIFHFHFTKLLNWSYKLISLKIHTERIFIFFLFFFFCFFLVARNA